MAQIEFTIKEEKAIVGLILLGILYMLIVLVLDNWYFQATGLHLGFN